MQKMKRGRGYAASYKPSVLVNEQRVVLAQPDELLLDAGYCCETTLEQDISLLCPEGRQPGELKKSKQFQKGHFKYDEVTESYQCPAGQQLRLLYKPGHPDRPRAQWVYGGAPCDHCPFQSQCTTSKTGRRIRRFKVDDAREALKTVMEHPAAKAVFKKRQAMVEPVFGYLRTMQNLNRFRRRGLNAVRLELSLHLLAYNLSRVVAAYITALLWLIRNHLIALGRYRIIMPPIYRYSGVQG